MNILYITYPLSPVLIYILVFSVAAFIARKYGVRWRLFFIGAAGFILSQVLHIPFNLLLLNPFLANKVQLGLPVLAGFAVTGLLLGLSAGLFEEITRYGMYRWWAKDARTWGRGLLLGSGWGGIEALLVGLLILYTFIQIVAIGGADLSTLLPPEQLDLARRQIEAYWSVPWYLSMLGFVERALVIPIQIALSVLVLQVFSRRQSRWLWFAVGWHTLIDAVPVFLLQYWREFDWAPYAIEGVIAIFTFISLAIILRLKQPEPIPAPAPVSSPEPLDITTLPEPELTSEDLEDSRYL